MNDDLDSTARPINNQIDTIDVTFYIQAYKADSPQFPSPWTPSDPGMYMELFVYKFVLFIKEMFTFLSLF